MPGRRAVVLLGAALSVAGCASRSTSIVGQPLRLLSPVQTLPPDLDVVLRVNTKRLAALLPRVLFDAALDGFESALRLGAWSAELEQADVLYLGIRPIPGPRRDGDAAVDYVVCIVGEGGAAPSSLEERAWRSRFFPMRDHGGGVISYRAKEGRARERVALVVERPGHYVVLASAAEVTPVERVAFDGGSVRQLQPSAQGVVSGSFDLAKLVPVLGERSPKLARFLAEAESAQGHLELKGEALRIKGRLRFETGSYAERAGQALDLLLEALRTSLGTGFQLDYEAVERELVFQLDLSLSLLLAWLGLSD